MSGCRGFRFFPRAFFKRALRETQVRGRTGLIRGTLVTLIDEVKR